MTPEDPTPTSQPDASLPYEPVVEAAGDTDSPVTPEQADFIAGLVSSLPRAQASVERCQHCGREYLRGAMCPVCMGTGPRTPSFASTGWICPGCGAVWGPHVAGCERCNQREETT